MRGAKTKSRYFDFLQFLNSSLIKLKMVYLRIDAHRLRKIVIKKKGKKVVDRQTRRSIKQYAGKRFGNKAYWPYLALYTEIRGEFIEGWLPHDYVHYVLLPRINPVSACEISEYKTFDYQIFGDFALKPLFVYISGMFLNADFEAIEEEQVIKTLEEHDATIVIKEDKGMQGMQVRMIHSTEFSSEFLNSQRSYIIQPYVKQYKAIDELYSGSVNTLRVTTFIKEDGSVEVKFVVLRFGTDGSEVDNISAGGQYIYFDTDGKPSKNAYDELGFDMGERHKNSGFVFADLKIPVYKDVLRACLSAHKKFPYVRLIGWDVCINESGKPLLLEWNTANPAFMMFEYTFGPFFPDGDLV
jgi:Sugar-transfer associated ATP-grasp